MRIRRSWSSMPFARSLTMYGATPSELRARWRTASAAHPRAAQGPSLADGRFYKERGHVSSASIENIHVNAAWRLDAGGTELPRDTCQASWRGPELCH